MKTNAQQEVVLFNPLTLKARHFLSISEAADYVGRDVSTVSRALSGDRNCRTVAGYLAIPAHVRRG
jgi:predicted transcriptional regulator